MPTSPPIPLPKKWPKHVKSALIHTLLGHINLTGSQSFIFQQVASGLFRL
jgi:hypothetical protein